MTRQKLFQSYNSLILTGGKMAFFNVISFKVLPFYKSFRGYLNVWPIYKDPRLENI